MTRPPSNLNPDAEPWGRYVSDEIENSAIQLRDASSDVENSARINNSALDSLASQIREIEARVVLNLDYPSVTTPSFTTGTFLTPLASVIIPAPTDAPRMGWLRFRTNVTQSVSTGTGVFISTFRGTSSLQSSFLFVLPSPSMPGFGNESGVDAFLSFVGIPGQPITLDFTARIEAQTPGVARTVTFTRSATVQYAQRVTT